MDDVAKQAGHEVVGLPVAHCELNPIEMAWSQMKHYIKTHNLKFTLREMERLTHIAFTAVTPDCWKSLLPHVKRKSRITTRLMDCKWNLWRSLSYRRKGTRNLNLKTALLQMIQIKLYPCSIIIKYWVMK